MASDIEDKAHSEHRLGLLILENKSGAALSAGVPHFRAAAEAWQQAGWSTRRAEVLSDLGRLHSKGHNYHDAAVAYTEAMRIFEGSDDAKRAIDTALGAGNAHLAGEEIIEALVFLKKAVELASKLNDHLRMASSMLDLARGQVAEAQKVRPAAAHEAISTCERARKIFDAFKRRIQVAESHELQAHAHAAVVEYAAAASHFQLSVQIHRDLGRSFEANEVLSNWAAMERDRGDYSAAIAIHQGCIAEHTTSGNQALVAQCQRRLGMVYAKSGDQAKAMEAYRHSLSLCRLVDDGAGTNRSLFLLGTTALRMGNEAEGLEHLQACVSEAKARGDVAHLEEALAALVSYHRTRGAYQQALEVMQSWVEAMHERGERQERLQVLGDMAEVHQEAGAMAEAEAHLRKLITVCTQPEDASERNRAHHNLGTLLSRRAAHHEAYDHFKEALQGFGEHAPGSRRAQILYQMGNACLNNREVELALQHFDKAHALCELDKNEKLRAKVLVGVGNAKAKLGQAAEARAIFDEAADLCEKQGDIRATTIIRRATQGLT